MMRVLLLVLAPAVASGFHAARILRKPQPSGLGATSTPEPPTRGVFHYDFHCDVTLTPPLLVLMPDGTCTIRVNGTLKMEGRGDVKVRTRKVSVEMKLCRDFGFNCGAIAVLSVEEFCECKCVIAF